MNEIDESIKKLFGLNSSSNKKGEISENIIYELFKNKFKNYSYEKTRHIPHNADGKLISTTGLTSFFSISSSWIWFCIIIQKKNQTKQMQIKI